MSVALANFLFEAANFIVLAAALGWVLFKPVRAALDQERERHRDREAKSQQMCAEAEQLMERAREMRALVEGEIEQDRAAVLAAAQRKAEETERQAYETQLARRAKFDAEMTAATQQSAHELAATVGKIAARSVHDLLVKVHSPALDLGLVEAACAEIRTMDSAERADPIVETACELDTGARDMLEAALGQSIREVVVAELGAGVRVSMAGGQVDASALGIARLAASEVTGAMTSTVGE